MKYCNECGTAADFKEGTMICPSCGHSRKARKNSSAFIRCFSSERKSWNRASGDNFSNWARDALNAAAAQVSDER